MDSEKNFAGKKSVTAPIIYQDKPFEVLKYILSIAHEQTRFAESKNAALLVFNSGLIIGLLTILPYDLRNCPLSILLYSISYVACNLVSIGFCLLAISPNLAKTKSLQIAKGDDINIFFFKETATISPRELVKKTYCDLGLYEDCSGDRISTQLANEIIIISEITCKKYKRFDSSIWWTISAIFTPILGALLYYFRNRIKR